MSVTKVGINTRNRYNKEKYDRINFFMQKGLKEPIIEHSKGQNESLNAFIRRAVAEQIQRDNATDTITFMAGEEVKDWLSDLAEKQNETVDYLVLYAISLFYKAEETQ